MNLLTVVQNITSEFDVEGCFLFDPDRESWITDLEDQSLRNFLAEQIRKRGIQYFSELRFFRFSDAARGTIKHLALIPLGIPDFGFSFLGLVYRNTEQLQEMLRYRVLPMYLINSIHQVRTAMTLPDEMGEKAAVLVKALEEKRTYARQLEHRVSALKSQIDQIKASEMSLDQKVLAMTKLLDEQQQEYHSLSQAYSNLFSDFQTIHQQYLASCVHFEQSIHELDLQKNELLKRLDGSPEEQTGRVRVAEHVALKAEAERARKESQRLKNRLAEIRNEYGGVPPEKVRAVSESAIELKREVARQRMVCQLLKQELSKHTDVERLLDSLDGPNTSV